MLRSTTWFFSLCAATAIASVGQLVSACELCDIPDIVPCVCPSVLETIDAFQEGGDEGTAAFRTVGNGWTSTASGSSPLREPKTLTWSVIPDGVSISGGQGEPTGPSTLRAFLDGIHHPGGGSPGGADLTQRDWFPIMKSAFDRWDAVSGLTFLYESQDDGGTFMSQPGSLGVRGDHRIGGHHIDGITSLTILAYNAFPNNSDMVIDTDEVGRYGNSSNNFRLFRNMLMHEIGHGLGLNHLDSSTFRYLMEPFLDTTFDGPQFDDVLGIHRLYGDRFEESGGNDTALIATNLGVFAAGQLLTLGEDAMDAPVAPTDVDFVSINHSGDHDYFKFSVANSGAVDIVLTPLGPTYQEGPQGGTQTSFVAASKNNLSLFLYDSTGTNLLTSSALAGLGVAESIQGFLLTNPGDYYVRVSGSADVAQLYQLDLGFVPEPSGAVLLASALLAFVGRGTRRA